MHSSGSDGGHNGKSRVPGIYLDVADASTAAPADADVDVAVDDE